MMFKSAPGKEGNQLVPDLAEAPGQASDGAKTWTYKLRKGVKFDDGTEVTSADVKYAVLRSTDKQTFPNGPAYWEGLLDLPSGYKGPYKTPNMNTDSAIETPDKYTIVFHMKKPFAAFDYLAQQPDTMPVPKDKDTGAKYRNSIVSTGPYKFADLQPGKSFNLVRNDQWDPATDPNRKALPDRIEVTLNVNADDIDNRISAATSTSTSSRPWSSTGRTEPGPAGSDPQGERGQPARRTRLQYTSINPTVPPFDNIECRKAIEYAMDRTAYQTAYGGQFAGGDLATTILPPSIPGYTDFDLYPNGPDHKGDLDAAKKSLEACGQPNGFETNIAYRRRAAQGEGHRRGVPAGAGSSWHQAHAEAVPAGRLLRPVLRPPAVRGEEQAGSVPQRLGEPTGLMASASCPRSSTRGSSVRPAVPPTPASASRRSTRCSTRR